MKKNPVLLTIVFLLLIKGSAFAKPLEIRSGVYRSDEIGIEFNIPGGWKESDFGINGADKVKCYIHTSKNPAMIIFCCRDIWKDISPLQKARYTRSNVSLDILSMRQIHHILKPFNLKIGELERVSWGGYTYLRTSVEEGAGESFVSADAVFTVKNGYCYLFVYSELAAERRYYSDFVKLLDSADYFRANCVSAGMGFILSFVISLFTALLPAVIYRAAILKGRPLDRGRAKRAAVILTVLPGAVVSAVLFLHFENIVSIFVFGLCAAFNYSMLAGGAKANVISYSIERVTCASDSCNHNEEKEG